MMGKAIGYSAIQIALHWLVLLMVTIQLIAAESMTESVDAIKEGGAVSGTTSFLGSVHFWFGLAILAAMLDAAMQGFPKPPEGMRRVNIEIPR